MEPDPKTVPAIVIDNGSGYCKAGFAGGEVPRSVFPTIIGRPRMPGIIISIDRKDSYVGDEAQTKRDVLTVRRPIDRGLIQNWDDMEKIWHHTFYNELRMAPEDYPCLMTEVPLNPREHREKMTEVMFETFNVPEFYVANQTVLSLFSTGNTTGAVLETGDGVTHTVPVYEGYALPHAIHRIDLAGSDLTDYLSKLLLAKGHSIPKPTEDDTVRNIKEKLGYVSDDYIADLDALQPTEELDTQFRRDSVLGTDEYYILPDGNMVGLTSERFQITELMFNPQLDPTLRKSEASPFQEDYQLDGFHTATYRTISACESEIQKLLYKCIVLSGGNSMFSGLRERMKSEIQRLAPQDCEVKVEAAKERKYAAWVGGSILSSLEMFQHMWIDKKEYEETGASIVHEKCF